MNSRWQANKIGLVDFWYYDVEEFYFSEGRMLLRGANGSGKSVTMQSFIPLLLDGNMRPERLDPFGSRARRMENYLLEENDEREERTAYLYMEFKRLESDTYLTIGMGMRARKNKKLESWYFIITDGRRINIDFQLYKDVGSKVVLTKRELRNRMGEGGHVYDFQSEYMEAVNRSIFGFEPEAYKEMIDLLIQLRTPKLSKDFKPSVINEILSSSLQMLSEEDLRPMSEAIENMDGLKTNVDNLKSSIEAAGKIERVYDRYNKAVLLEKAELFQNQCEKYEQLTAKAEEQKSRGEKLAQTCIELEKQMNQNKQEEQVRKEELDSLNASDVTRLKERELEVQHKVEEDIEKIKGKQLQIDGKEENWRELNDKKKRVEEKAEETEDKLLALLEDMGELVEDQSFDEHIFMAEELKKQIKEPYSFETHKTLLKQRQEKVEQAAEGLRKQKRVQDELDEKLIQLDREKVQRDRAERERNHYEIQFSEIKSESVEKLYRWEQENKELKLERVVLQKIAAALEKFNEQSDFGDIREYVRDVKTETEDAFQNQKRSALRKEEEKSEQLHEKKEELRVWEEMKEPEPEVSDAVRRNRAKLREQGIPYIQFYKAIDYPVNMSREQQNNLEEALSAMGILDALIIPSNYRETILQMDSGMCDKYIFSDVDRIKGNLEDVLEIDNSENDILFYQQVSRALSSIGFENQHHTAVNENGSYQIGTISGTITKEYEAKFIGAKARERYRQAHIGKLQEEIGQLQEEYDRIHAQAEEWSARIACLNQEFKCFLSGEDLKLACREYVKACRYVEQIQEGVQALEAKTQEISAALNTIKLNNQMLCEAVYLPLSLESCEAAVRDLKEYSEQFMTLVISHNSYVNQIHRIWDMKDQIEGIDLDLDNLRYDLGVLERSRQAGEQTLVSIREQLKLTNYEEIKERIDYCTERLNRLPVEYVAMAQEKAVSEEQLQGIKDKQVQDELEIGAVRQRKQYFREIFTAEWKLGYVEIPGSVSGFTDEENSSSVQDAEELSRMVCRYFRELAERKKVQELLGDLQSVYHENRAQLAEYQLTMERLFVSEEEQIQLSGYSISRIDIVSRYAGIKVKFRELMVKLKEDMEEQEALLGDKDRELFEDILANTISKKIRAKIKSSNAWVSNMNELMGSMKTSSGLTLSLKWRSKSAEHEEQLSTRELVELLKKDVEIMREEDVEKLSRHFRSKIAEARKLLEQGNAERSFHAIMREILDYRKWFEFQLECQKTGENKKELTDRVFYTFSGGEKAMSMYVPLFSAVVAKYQSANADAPRLISLDEAFAGVDETNIKDMFRLMVGFEFNFMINSQILYGDYDTVPQLAIYQLVRPENAKYVSVIRYHWNGSVRELVTGEANG